MVAITLPDQVHDLLVAHVLSQLLRHAFDALEGDLARTLILKVTECLLDLLARISIMELVECNVAELVKVKLTIAIFVQVGDDLLDLFL